MCLTFPVLRITHLWLSTVARITLIFLSIIIGEPSRIPIHTTQPRQGRYIDIFGEHSICVLEAVFSFGVATNLLFWWWTEGKLIVFLSLALCGEEWWTLFILRKPILPALNLYCQPKSGWTECHRNDIVYEYCGDMDDKYNWYSISNLPQTIQCDKDLISQFCYQSFASHKFQAVFPPNDAIPRK